MTLEVDIEAQRGAFQLNAAFTGSGGLTALFGASGSGKTSIVDLIGGLSRPTKGRIVLDGAVLVDTAAGIFVPSHRRRIGYVFQDARLFPHMTVARNLRYGRWFTPPRERYADIDRIVELLGIGALLERRPDALSGGEKQRVAIGRALIASPRLLLMDEPLASLDDARKAEILPFIERLRDELSIPIVYVSHSVGEVARLASDIVVMGGGRVLASGPAAEILQRPDFLPEAERGEGGTVLEGHVSVARDSFGITQLETAAGMLRVTGTDAPVGARLRLRIRARDVMIATEAPHGLSALNVLPGTVASVSSADGPVADVLIDCGGQMIAARITGRSRLDLCIESGRTVFAVIKSVSMDQAFAGPAVTGGNG